MDRCEAGCRRHAVTWWSNDTDESWFLCGPCSDRHADRLVSLGYRRVIDDRDEVSQAAQCAPST